MDEDKSLLHKELEHYLQRRGVTLLPISGNAMASSPVYSSSDDDDPDDANTTRETARHEARRDDERDHCAVRARGDGDCGSSSRLASGLTLEKMLNRLNQDGPLDAMLHVLVREGNVCPFSTVGIGKLRGLHSAIESAGVKLELQKQPLVDILASVKPCKGHAMRGFSLGHLCTHAKALAVNEYSEKSIDVEIKSLLHKELEHYLERRGVTPVDPRQEKADLKRLGQTKPLQGGSETLKAEHEAE